MKLHKRKADFAFGDRRGAITSHYLTLLDGWGNRQIGVWLRAALRMQNHTRIEARPDFTTEQIVKGSVAMIGGGG